MFTKYVLTGGSTMAEIMGLGMFHGPHPGLTDETMANVYFKRVLQDPRTPADVLDRANWPQGLIEEWGADEGVAAARRHREVAIDACLQARKAVDEFNPDIVVIFADDQYENFKEDVLPPFCVYAADEFDLADLAKGAPKVSSGLAPEPLPHPPLQPTVRGSKAIGTYLANALVRNDFDVACAWKLHHMDHLGHAFSHSVDYLDWERKGFPYPIIPFHVSCYGTNLKVPSLGPITPGRLQDDVDIPPPDSPTPKRCYDIGREVAQILEASPYRSLIIGSASWSHASLTPMHGYLWGDVESDRVHLEELRSGQFAKWRDMSAEQMQVSGQHEMRNWVALAGALEGRDVEVLGYAETYVFNSSKCVALFR
ncbi:hypothetical protein AB0J74_35445 [Asanoa sp. NPDC049573]|uniref:DODA-type extradiol aromatic ring-opening family dioxygenase n=1 Tax=Asanoa sp. NPDC049573 TaxID=3155396 RepID=UPI003438F597